MFSPPERATPDDADEIARLFLLARAAALGAIPPIPGTEAEAFAWLTQRVRGGVCTWVVRDPEGIAGFMLLETGWLDQLYVRPGSTGLGIGSALIRVAKVELSEGFLLWTFQSNTGARRFYERHGCVPVRYTNGEDNMEKSPDVCYRWRPESEGLLGVASSSGAGVVSLRANSAAAAECSAVVAK